MATEIKSKVVCDGDRGVIRRGSITIISIKSWDVSEVYRNGVLIYYHLWINGNIMNKGISFSNIVDVTLEKDKKSITLDHIDDWQIINVTDITIEKDRIEEETIDIRLRNVDVNMLKTLCPKL